ncbi:MAG: ABC transporter permease, partial [Alphaproteobacteria bacterium]|nr:ABC transporter permease [Alphaproteobacteria bacterium]
TLLFYAVFSMGMGSQQAKIGHTPFLSFVIPGLIVMSMAQSAFMNTAASLILSKIQENIVDVLMSPLGPTELTIGYAIGGVVRGLLVGALSYGVLTLLTPLPLLHPLIALFFAVMGTLMLSLIGLLTGIWGDKFDHLGSVMNFIIMPATFLSGTFFSLDSLPESWHFVCTMNPFFYLIDGFRYSFTGTADSFLWGGMAMLVIVNIVLFTLSYWLFAHGTFLKK